MAANEPEETYLTVAEVAETLKLNQQTVRNWIDQGTLPALRVGRRVRIKRSDFERILEQSYNPGSQASVAEGPSAEDFWGGEPVGLAEPRPERAAPDSPERNGVASDPAASDPAASDPAASDPAASDPAERNGVANGGAGGGAT